ncbi:MAG: hypothetical protein JJ693_02740 [Acidithiobacillus sp.]|nr:hypothetical protein [Acidithiobacillus sp.]
MVLRGVAGWYAWQGQGAQARVLHPEYTATSNLLPGPVCARVENLQNGRSLEVRITGRGPDDAPGLLQLSVSAAQALGVFPGTAIIQINGLQPVARTVPVSPQKPLPPDRCLWSAPFATLNEALQAKQILADRGIHGLLLAPGILHGKTAYRLRLGPLPTTISLQSLAQVLSKENPEYPFRKLGKE